ncbi:uncharacterized protein ACBR49_000827 [Aulostomus maculatus]
MAAGAFLLLLSSVLATTPTKGFYGDSVSFLPVQEMMDGTYKVTFHHRENGRSRCGDQSSYSCEDSVCTSLDEKSVQQTDRDSTGEGRWCQSESTTTATVSTNKTYFSLSNSGCCWASNVDGQSDWTAEAMLDLGTRSDSHTINSCPVTTTLSLLRVAQNCFTQLHLLALDPDGDDVRCRFAADGAAPSNFILDETACTLAANGSVSQGVHVLELMLEDFPTQNLTLTYADGTSKFWDVSSGMSLCSLKLQFTLEILPPLPSCEAGHVLPMFLSQTPSHGDVLHATVGQKFELHVQAQAHHASIQDFQVSGPQNMTKEFMDDHHGEADLTLSWTPHISDQYRFVPVCFSAETNESQSEMRCVVIVVSQATVTQGKATVTCAPNKMMVALEKASMPGIDENFLQLLDPSCSLTFNDTHIMGSMSFSTCGTKLEDKGDFIVFTNEITSFVLPSEIIVRRRTVKVDFSCQFPKTVSISSSYNLHKSDYIFTESSFGSFGYAFEIFLDSNFTNKVRASAYPVEVKLLEMIYMGIQAESDLPNVNLFVESCRATPDDNPENIIYYDLIKGGCMEDETIVVHESDSMSYNFEIQAFKFTGNFDQVYVTCTVILCELGNPFSRCAQGCLKEPFRRRRRELSMETYGHRITQGPLLIRQAVPNAAVENEAEMGNADVLIEENDVVIETDTDMVRNDEALVGRGDTIVEVRSPPFSSETQSSGGVDEIKEILSMNMSLVVFICAFSMSVVLLVMVVVYCTWRRRADDHKPLLVPEWDS